MKTLLSALGLLGLATSLCAQNAAPARPEPVEGPPAASAAPMAATSTAPARAARPPPDTHGLDMRTQSGPAATMSSRGYSPPVPVDPALPTLWLIGDSTVRNGSPGNGSTNAPDGQWGWGAPLTFYFDAKKINVVNRALGGTSSHSFYDANWQDVVDLVKKGDFVLMQFGANDSSTASVPGVGDEMRGNLHTFGWYMTQFVTETRAKGATPIICSLTPRKNWLPDGHMRRDDTTHVAWVAQVAKDTNTAFVNLYELIERKYDQLGQDKVDLLYVPTPAEAAAQTAETGKKVNAEGLHTGWEGAIANAECVISGLKALTDDPLAPYFSDKAKDIPAVDVGQPEAPLKAAPPAASAAPAAKPAASGQ
jgi:lysophospholipase L1-like esterase